MRSSSRLPRAIVVALATMLFGGLSAAVAPALQAQVRPDSGQVRPQPPVRRDSQPQGQEVQRQMEMMGPMMGQMMQAMMQGTLAVLAQPETAERIAAFTRNYYDALVAKGFTKEQALQIVMAHGVPTMPSVR